MKPPQCASSDEGILDSVTDVLWGWCEYHSGNAEYPPGQVLSRVTSEWYQLNGKRVHPLGKYFSMPDEKRRLWITVCDIEEHKL